MNHLPEPSPTPSEQRPIQDAREHFARLLEPAHKLTLRKLLEGKPKAELIDAMFEMSHLPDLLDYFKEDIERNA